MTESALSTTYRIEIRARCEQQDDPGRRFADIARQLGIGGLAGCQEIRLYFAQGSLTPREARWIGQALLADPVTEAYEILDGEPDPAAPGGPAASYAQSVAPDHLIEATLLPGVTDPAAENLVRAARLAGAPGLERAATGRCFLLWGDLSPSDLHRLAVEVFSNPVIQRTAIDRPIDPPFVPARPADATVETIPLQYADEAMLMKISRDRRLALDLDEMMAIQGYYLDEEREPTDAELEMLAQTWSEHCVHKTFKALIDYREIGDWRLEIEDGADSPSPNPQSHAVNGLLHSYIRAATEAIHKPWVRSAFVDNAGIVAFDDRYDLAFKVETHNHPSALEPFGGANTGVGGVVRDILGVSARPIANTDVLCFGPPDLPASELPAGVLHPLRVADGVARGVEDYGNKMGIPTVNGAILYHPGYTANPLVFCGCLGILPRGSHPNRPQTGDLIVVVGGRTGRDGLRGATFSSMEMDQATGRIAGSAVQIGHPIHEKQVMEVVLRARDEKLYNAITDCGAGGLSSAVGEMGRRVGARVHLERVPLKYPGLRPWEIWLSEAQERMVLAVSESAWPRLKALCDGQDIEAVCIGQFESTERLKLLYGEAVVGDLSMDFLHDGIPRRRLKAAWEPEPGVERWSAEAARGALSPRDRLLALLASPNIRSKEAIIRRYDHEVQGGGVVKPLVGAADHGPSDAAVLRPLDAVLDGEHSAPAPGVALSAGICPQYSERDPYAMAWAAIDEAMRNAVAVGADPDRVALLDNFCWGNPNLPDRLGGLVRCAQGCLDAALAYQAPFVSGKDSLNNEYLGADGRKHAIPGTLLISALGIVPDIERACTMDLKRAGHWLYLLGDTRDEAIPQPHAEPLERLRAAHRAIAAGLVQSCHDCSEGGLGVAVAEMCLAGRLGARLEVSLAPGAESISADAAGDDVLLHAESLGRLVFEVRPEDAPAFELAMSGQPCARVGQTTADGELSVAGRAGAFRVPVSELEAAWRGVLPQPALPPAHPHSPIPNPHSPITNLPPSPGRPRALILHATGVNRDRDAAAAVELAGGDPEIVHLNQLLAGERNLLDYGLLIVPGGFSYGDDLGAGVLWALDLTHRLGEAIQRFTAEGRPVLGICNGFQALVKSGLLPGLDALPARSVTLTYNASQRFECRWVRLKANAGSPCLFTKGIEDLITCPVAHGEGRLAVSGAGTLAALQARGLVALTYVDASGAPAGYPANPNGSVDGIAGLCNPAGNVLGLMPHPENHIFGWQHPRWRRGEAGGLGLQLFINAIRAA
jgi:phosphoribosylformylglycinamidine synthase